MEQSALMPYITDISILELLLSDIFSKKINIMKIRKHMLGYNCSFNVFVCS